MTGGRLCMSCVCCKLFLPFYQHITTQRTHVMFHVTLFDHLNFHQREKIASIFLPSSLSEAFLLCWQEMSQSWLTDWTNGSFKFPNNVTHNHSEKNNRSLIIIALNVFFPMRESFTAYYFILYWSSWKQCSNLEMLWIVNSTNMKQYKLTLSKLWLAVVWRCGVVVNQLLNCHSNPSRQRYCELSNKKTKQKRFHFKWQFLTSKGKIKLNYFNSSLVGIIVETMFIIFLCTLKLYFLFNSKILIAGCVYVVSLILCIILDLFSF